MSAHKLLQTIGDKEMDRKDFLKYLIFVIAGVVGIKSLLALIASVDINPDLSLSQGGGKADNSYNRGKYNQ